MSCGVSKAPGACTPQPADPVKYLSEILLQNHDLESFADLVGAVRRHAAGERFLHMDIKPPYFDTPDNWEDVLEAAFTAIARDDPDG